MARKGKRVEGLALTALMVGAALLARRGSARAWTGMTGEDDTPAEQDNEDVSAGKALTWAVASGAAVGLSRLLVRRIIGYRGTPL